MAIAAYPFVGSVGETQGRLLKLQHEAHRADIQRRLREQYGDRDFVSRIMHYDVSSFLDWGVIAETKKAGVYLRGKQVQPTNAEQLAWLAEAVLDNVSFSNRTISGNPGFGISITSSSRRSSRRGRSTWRARPGEPNVRSVRTPSALRPLPRRLWFSPKGLKLTGIYALTIEEDAGFGDPPLVAGIGRMVALYFMGGVLCKRPRALSLLHGWAELGDEFPKVLPAPRPHFEHRAATFDLAGEMIGIFVRGGERVSVDCDRLRSRGPDASNSR